MHLTRSALTDDTALIGKTVVFTCRITGTGLIWDWNNITIITYNADRHNMSCGKRTRYSMDEIMDAEIYTSLTVIGSEADDEGNRNCTSILEITPTTSFSDVNISCAATTAQQNTNKNMPLSAKGYCIIHSNMR